MVWLFFFVKKGQQSLPEKKGELQEFLKRTDTQTHHAHDEQSNG